MLGLIDVGCWSLYVKCKLAKKGDIVSYRRRPLLACAFEDRKHVVILSTHGSGRSVKYMSRGNMECVNPDCIRQYNQYMGGVLNSLT